VRGLRPAAREGPFATAAETIARPAVYLLIAAALATLPACSSEPELVFADWILPMPEGTPVREHAPLPIEGRDPQAIQLVDGLVIGNDIGNPASIVYQPGRIAATADGTIFVADGSTADIKMFGPDGGYLKTIGQEGQGPAEFGRVSSMTIAGDRLVVWDSRNRRFSLWTLAGEHIGEAAPESRIFMSNVSGLADGTVVGLESDLAAGDDLQTLEIKRRRTDGAELGIVLAIDGPSLGSIDRSNPRGSIQSMIDSSSEPRVIFDVAARERLFASPMHEYQVQALTHEGTVDWALRTAWQRQPYNDYNRQRMVESLAEFLMPEDEEVKASEFDWSVPYPAIQYLRSDAAGRLYVFPAVQAVSEERPDEYPVDVYSPDGEFIAAGVVPMVWIYAQGEHVYGVRPDDNDEMVAVRYRLVVNGQ